METYRFKYTNYDLDKYIAERKSVAIMKRREAEMLRLEADTIDNEMFELEKNLIPETNPNVEPTLNAFGQ